MRREMFVFLLVGVGATLIHITMAILLQGVWGLRPQQANFGGYLAAVGVSYFGHARLTFHVSENHTVHLPKFIIVSLVGLSIGSWLVAYLDGRHDGAFAYTMGVVGAVVATTTFLLSKFWVFAQVRPGPKDVS